MSNPDAKEPAQAVNSRLQPQTLISAMPLLVAFLSLCVAVGSLSFAIKMMSDKRNAELVAIGVGVLRADPTKEGHISAAREWAMNLIDDNAGGIKLSQEARLELNNRKLDADYSYRPGFSSTYTPSYDSTYTPGAPVRSK
jgi:hypothetical protein